MKFLSPQSRSIYQLLIKNEALTPKEIGEKLDILPNAVYRSIKPLILVGFVEKAKGYPARFKTTTPSNAVNAYLLKTKENFLQSFFPKGISSETQTDKELSISFIKDRPELLERSNDDMSQAKQQVDILVSGLEVPAETILEYKRACERGVKIRTLVQRLDESNQEMLKNWRRIGIDVRFFPLLEARIIIFDNKIVYITSYNPEIKDESIGIRLNYSPIAKLMKELFESRWKTSSEIPEN